MAAEEGQVIGCHTNDVWTVQLGKAKESNKLVRIRRLCFAIPCTFFCAFLLLYMIWELGFRHFMRAIGLITVSVHGVVVSKIT